MLIGREEGEGWLFVSVPELEQSGMQLLSLVCLLWES